MDKRTLRAHAAFAAITTFACASAFAQPSFGNASPNAGSATSQRANAAADQVTYKEVEYTNKGRQGPVLVVIPGDIKSSNAGFMQKFGPNNIADFGELELSQANFQVLERSNLGPLLNEVSMAYNLGDADAARKSMSIGRLKTTKWVVKFDILKAEPVSENKQGFDGRAAGSMLSNFGGGMFGGGIGSLVAGQAVSTVKTDEASAVWLVGMRYKIMDATTTEQVAQGYKELKMEVGANSTSVMGISQQNKGGIGMDTMIQRLVQTTVWEIDNKYK